MYRIYCYQHQIHYYQIHIIEEQIWSKLNCSSSTLVAYGNNKKWIRFNYTNKNSHKKLWIGTLVVNCRWRIRIPTVRTLHCLFNSIKEFLLPTILGFSFLRREHAYVCVIRRINMQMYIVIHESINISMNLCI